MKFKPGQQRIVAHPLLFSGRPIETHPAKANAREHGIETPLYDVVTTPLRAAKAISN